MFGALYAADGMAQDPEKRAALAHVAREFSPRIEICEPREITLDLSGLSRLFGDARTIAGELRRTAADRGLQVRVAIAATRATARLLVRYRAGVTVVEPGTEAEALAVLPLTLLDGLTTSNTQLPTSNTESVTATLRKWGLRTMGEFAALPPDEVAVRLGRAGVAWQRVALGEDWRPLVPAIPEERFEQTLELEWPIEGLEPLSFVLGRLMEPLSTHLERRDRGAAVLHVRLHLVTRVVYERSLQLPAPMRDARALRTLALLDLESHPPDAAIDRVTVAVDPTPGRVVQFSLLTRPLPSPEQLSTLTARLSALMGEGRCGSPELVDSWRPGVFAMKPFVPRDTHEPRSRGGAEFETSDFLRDSASPRPVVGLRRFRRPVPVRVQTEEGRPVRVSGGHVAVAAGPWRTSGAWWENAPVAPKLRSSEGGWDRDEWDVALADGVTYRLFHERLLTDLTRRSREAAQQGLPSRSPKGEGWFVEGVVD